MLRINVHRVIVWRLYVGKKNKGGLSLLVGAVQSITVCTEYVLELIVLMDDNS